VGSQWGEQKREVCYTGMNNSSIHIKSSNISLQVLISIQMRKPVNGSAWIRLVYTSYSFDLSISFCFISLIVKNLSKVMKILLLALHDLPIKKIMMTMMMVMMIFPLMRVHHRKRKNRNHHQVNQSRY